MMIVVDRSGSVQRAGTGPAIRKALTDFVTNMPAFADGRDAIGLGSFGGTWKLDFAPASSFRSGVPNIAAAIQGIQFFNGVTKTAEALYQAYTELQRPGNNGVGDARVLNVIVLLTDGRPNAFTATFDVPRTCDASGKKTGYITATIGMRWPPLPPLGQGEQGIYTLGLFKPDWTAAGDMTAADNSEGCKFAKGGRLFHEDAPLFPDTDAHGNSTTGPVYPVEGRNTASPRAVRYAAINAADNMAARIRKDTVLRPLLMVVGLNEPPVAGEPLDRIGWPGSQTIRRTGARTEGRSSNRVKRRDNTITQILPRSEKPSRNWLLTSDLPPPLARFCLFPLDALASGKHTGPRGLPLHPYCNMLRIESGDSTIRINRSHICYS